MEPSKSIRFSNPYIFATQCRRSYVFQTINSLRLNNLSLKYQMFMPSGCKDIQIKKFEFVTKTEFFYKQKTFKLLKDKMKGKVQL